MGQPTQVKLEKLKCIVHYFSRLFQESKYFYKPFVTFSHTHKNPEKHHFNYVIHLGFVMCVKMD